LRPAQIRGLEARAIVVHVEEVAPGVGVPAVLEKWPHHVLKFHFVGVFEILIVRLNPIEKSARAIKLMPVAMLAKERGQFSMRVRTYMCFRAHGFAHPD
jgi:hypothetical protein